MARSTRLVSMTLPLSTLCRQCPLQAACQSSQGKPGAFQTLDVRAHPSRRGNGVARVSCRSLASTRGRWLSSGAARPRFRLTGGGHRSGSGSSRHVRSNESAEAFSAPPRSAGTWSSPHPRDPRRGSRPVGGCRRGSFLFCQDHDESHAGRTGRRLDFDERRQGRCHVRQSALFGRRSEARVPRRQTRPAHGLSSFQGEP